MSDYNLFIPTDAAWTARPRDPNDMLMSEMVAPGQLPSRVALFGIPFDGAVIGRPGARGGPDAIRQELSKLKPWAAKSGELDLSLADWGNIDVPPSGSVAEVHERVEAATRQILESGAFPLALGGDHSLTYPLVSAHKGRRPRMGVINLDAHLDVRDVIDDQLNSGQSFGRLLDTGLVSGENLVEVGIRDFANSPRYAEKARNAGVTIISAEEWREDGISAIEYAVEIASNGVDGVYLSVDVDVLDQAHGPGVSAPTPGGIDTNALFAAIRHIARSAPLVGADFVELAPPLDRDRITARATAYGVMHLLAGLPRA